MDKPNDVAVARAQPRPPAIVQAVLPLPAAAPRAPVSRPAAVAVVEPSLVGRKIHNTFKGFGKRLFVGEIKSYDDAEKTYTVVYDDGYEEEYKRPQIKNT